MSYNLFEHIAGHYDDYNEFDNWADQMEGDEYDDQARQLKEEQTGKVIFSPDQEALIEELANNLQNKYDSAGITLDSTNPDHLSDALQEYIKWRNNNDPKLARLVRMAHAITEKNFQIKMREVQRQSETFAWRTAMPQFSPESSPYPIISQANVILSMADTSRWHPMIQHDPGRTMGKYRTDTE